MLPLAHADWTQPSTTHPVPSLSSAGPPMSCLAKPSGATCALGLGDEERDEGHVAVFSFAEDRRAEPDREAEVRQR